MQKHYSAVARKVLRFATVFGELSNRVNAKRLSLLRSDWDN